MELQFLWKGLVIGFGIAAPVGPIGVLCIRRTLAHGRLVGLLSGLGAATADAVYGAMAGFGVTVVAAFLLQQQFWLRLLGGLFLMYLGGKAFLAAPTAPSPSGKNGGLLAAYTSTFLLTLTNPATILSFAAIFAGAGLASAAGNYGQAIVLVAGVFAGSALWWLLLSGGVSIFRAKLTPDRLRWVNRLAGVVIGGFGLFILAGVI
jgi:threonine/homoserine/homoserine lactone efflux protein